MGSVSSRWTAGCGSVFKKYTNYAAWLSCHICAYFISPFISISLPFSVFPTCSLSGWDSSLFFPLPLLSHHSSLCPSRVFSWLLFFYHVIVCLSCQRRLDSRVIEKGISVQGLPRWDDPWGVIMIGNWGRGALSLWTALCLGQLALGWGWANQWAVLLHGFYFKLLLEFLSWFSSVVNYDLKVYFRCLLFFPESPLFKLFYHNSRKKTKSHSYIVSLILH